MARQRQTKEKNAVCGRYSGQHERFASFKDGRTHEQAIAEKIRQNQLVILEELKLEDHKTKNLKKVLATLEAPKALIVTENMSRELMLASRNLQGVHAINQQSLNVYELLRFPKVIFVKDAMESLNARLSG